MCTIAGYVGNRRAVEVLVEMMRKEQFFDSGLSTGIATVHEGKLYTAKVMGPIKKLNFFSLNLIIPHLFSYPVQHFLLLRRLS